MTDNRFCHHGERSCILRELIFISSFPQPLCGTAEHSVAVVRIVISPYCTLVLIYQVSAYQHDSSRDLDSAHTATHPGAIFHSQR
jgi:hypothetical protein